MANELAKHNLFFDYLYNLRLLDPQLSTETTELKEKCVEYTDKLQEFRQIIDEFIKIAEGIVSEVEEEKLNAIGAQNILKSMAKQKETKEQDIQNQIMEKTVQLEQLKIQLQYLQRIEDEQEDLIHNFYEDH